MLHQTPTNRLLLSLLVLIARVDGFVPMAGSGRTSTSIYVSDYSRSTGQPQQQVRTGESPPHFMSKADDARKQEALNAVEKRLAALQNEKNAPAANLAQAPGKKGSNPIGTKTPEILVQGGSLKTWSFKSTNVQRVRVDMKTEGRPLESNVELWQGPDNTPQKMRIYIEDGSFRTFSSVLETPFSPNTIAIRNTANLEFPLSASVASCHTDYASYIVRESKRDSSHTIQGGALRTYPFDLQVESVQVLLTTDGRPLNARIELLQGPNNNKQVIEVYTEDGNMRPFYIEIDTPGSGNVVRVVNTATVEFPLAAWVVPLEINEGIDEDEPVIGGDPDSFMNEKRARW